MSKRQRFNRNAQASSRGSYVRKSHFLLIQEELAKRGFKETIEDIIEVSITVKVKPKHIIRWGDLVMEISEEEYNQRFKIW